MVPSFGTAMEWLIQSIVTYFWYDAIFTKKTLSKNHQKLMILIIRSASPAPRLTVPHTPILTTRGRSRPAQVLSQVFEQMSSVMFGQKHQTVRLLTPFSLFRPSERSWNWPRFQSSSSRLRVWGRPSPGTFSAEF